MENKRQKAFEKLYTIIKKLRSPQGCPWDKEQTPFTLRETLLEECFETIEAINEKKPLHVCEEIGDVLLNIIMLAYMYEQMDAFTITDALDKVSDKLIRRHPHVFGQTQGFEGPNSILKTETPEEVLAQWETIKRGVEGRKKSHILDEVSKGLPSLQRAFKLQKKAAKQGFDWTSVEAVWEKIEEEILEVKNAISAAENVAGTAVETARANDATAAGGAVAEATTTATATTSATAATSAAATAVASATTASATTTTASATTTTASATTTTASATTTPTEIAETSAEKIEDEIGDLLFAVVNLARHLNIHPSLALARSNEKFTQRFAFVEKSMKESNIPMDKNHVQEMDAFWNVAKTARSNDTTVAGGAVAENGDDVTATGGAVAENDDDVTAEKTATT